MDQLPLGLDVKDAVIVALVGALLWTFRTLVRKLANGELATGRELREKNAQIDALQATVKARDEQLSVVLHDLIPTLTQFMSSLRAAAKKREKAP